MRRRRLQSVVIGVVVGLSSAMIALALGVIAAASGPFDHAFAAQRSDHLTVAFDATKTSPAQLADPGAAGPRRGADRRDRGLHPVVAGLAEYDVSSASDE